MHRGGRRSARYFESWAEALRPALLAARYRAPAHRFATIDVAALMAYGTSVPDSRTEEEHASDIETYLAKATPAPATRAVRHQAQRAETILTVEVEIRTDDYIAGYRRLRSSLDPRPVFRRR